MKLTTDYDRDQNVVFRRKTRSAQLQPDSCACETMAEHILRGDSPAQLHKWAMNVQPAKPIKEFISSLVPPVACQSTLGRQFSHSANQFWPPAANEMGSSVAASGGQYGQHSFGSLERSAAVRAATGCEHRLLFLAIMSSEKTGYLTLLHSWGVSLATNVRDSRAQGPMHWAVQRQALGCVQELLQLSPREERQAHLFVLARDRQGITPLHLAASFASARILKLLLDALGAHDLHSAAMDCEGMTPLHHAAASGSASCCELLLAPEWQLPVDLKDRQGRTPLHLAAWDKWAPGVVRLLASKKAIVATVRDEQGWTPVHIALIAHNRPVLEALLAALDARAGTQIFDRDSRTPLHYAALYDRAELALLLIKSGASNNTRDRFNVTPAHYAAQSASFDTLCAVLANQESHDWQPLDSEGRTPFMWAVIAQNEPMVRQMLLDKRYDAAKLLSFRDAFKRTPLHLAALSGAVEVCKMLVTNESQLGLNADQDENGATPEHLAAGQGNTELVLWFGYLRGHLQPPLDVMDRNPFFYACLGGQTSTVEAMLRSLHIDADHLDVLGCSALHCAVISGSLHCVRTLAHSKLNFEPSQLDRKGRSPVDIAREQNSAEIVQYLEGKMQKKQTALHRSH